MKAVRIHARSKKSVLQRRRRIDYSGCPQFLPGPGRARWATRNRRVPQTSPLDRVFPTEGIPS